jgi:serine acetyltransferase
VKLLNEIKRDWKVNRDIKIKLSLFLFRIGTDFFYRKNTLLRLIYYLIKFAYKLIVEFGFNIELPLGTKVGLGFKIEHGQGLVINRNSSIGDNVSVKHNITIGCKTDSQGHCIKQSVIGNNVIIHPHTCIIGSTIGDFSIIGAGSIVVKDFENNVIIAGNPAQIIKESI